MPFFGAFRARIRVATVFLSCGVLVPVVLVVGTSPAVSVGASVGAVASTGSADPGVAWSGADAEDQAAATGVPVEVGSARTEWASLFAEPDGEWTLESSAAAVRTRVGAAEGEWRDVDPTLRVNGDGTVTPVAPALPLSFSGGGDDQLARIARDGHSLGVSWPGMLPDPVVEGTQVTYPGVLDGVDLVVSVDPDGSGFSEVLVVDSPQAAANPALRGLELGLAPSAGLTVQDSGAGGFDVVDETGDRVFSSPAPVMWDSSGAAGTAPVAGPGLSSKAAPAGAGGARGMQRSFSPREGDRVAPVATRVSQGAVRLDPDEGMLTGPDTVWPVFIDPYLSGSRLRWTMITSGWPNSTSGFKFSGDEGMGRCDVSWDSSCGVNQTKRLAWRFGNLSDTFGGDVSDAVFTVHGTHSWDCSHRDVKVFRVDDFTSSSDWANRSGWGDSRFLTKETVAHSAWCPDSNDQPRDIKFTVTSGAQWSADHSEPLTLGLRAGNESSMVAWKRYRYDATLRVKFNHAPDRPSNMHTTSPSTGCELGSQRPWISDPTPVLHATIKDPDAAYGDKVRAHFEWSKKNDDGTWGSWNELVTSYASSGSDFTWGTNRSDGYYRWQVRGYDGEKYGPWSWAGEDQWTCYFQIDTVPPAAPVVSAAAPYQFDQWYTGDPAPVTVTVDNGGDSSVDRFKYSVGSSTPTTIRDLSGGSGSFSFTPSSGVTTVSVRLLDKAGNQGPVFTDVVKVTSPTVQHGWMVNEPDPTVTSTADSAPSGSGLPLTWGSGVTVVDGDGGVLSSGEADTALHVAAGSDGPATSGSAVFPIGAFTVTARVHLDDLAPQGGDFVAVSQDGATRSSFRLGYDQTGGSWAAWMAEDDQGTVWQTLSSGVAPVDNLGGSGGICPPICTSGDGTPDWAYLALVHDPVAGEVRLYVNDGTTEKVVVMPDTDVLDWAADDGALRVGGTLQDGLVSSATASGAVDDVTVFDSALDEPTLRRLVTTQTEAELAAVRSDLAAAGE